jgi:hypothetical protein
LTLPAPAKPALPTIAFGAGGIELRTFEDAYRFASAVAKSGLAPKGLETPEKILIALQAGLELGFSPMRALSAVAVVNGRPSLMGEAALAKIRQSGVCKHGPTIATRGEGDKLAGVVRFQRDGMAEPIEVTFSVADAKRAGLWGKSGPWTQYPTTMLEWRAVARAAKLYFSDVLLGLALAEEVQDYPTTRVERELPPRAPERDPLLESVVDAQFTAPSAPAEGPSDGVAEAGGAVSPWTEGDDSRCVECSRLRSRIAQLGHEETCSLGAER